MMGRWMAWLPEISSRTAASQVGAFYISFSLLHRSRPPIARARHHLKIRGKLTTACATQYGSQFSWKKNHSENLIPPILGEAAAAPVRRGGGGGTANRTTSIAS